MYRLYIAAMLLLAGIGPAWASPQGVPPPRVFRGTALVKEVYGTAQKRAGPTGDFKNINNGDILTPQTTVKTGDNAAVLLQLPGGHIFRVGEKTTVELRELGVGKSFSFNVLAGAVWSAVRKVNQPTKYEIETPSAVAGVSGTLFSVFHDVDSGETTVSTNNGQVDVQQLSAPGVRIGAPVHVGIGQYLQAKRGAAAGSGAPALAPLVVRPQPQQFAGMWRMIHKEGWVAPQLHPGPPRLDRTLEPALRKTVFLRTPMRPNRPAGGPKRLPGNRRMPAARKRPLGATGGPGAGNGVRMAANGRMANGSRANPAGGAGAGRQPQAARKPGALRRTGASGPAADPKKPAAGKMPLKRGAAVKKTAPRKRQKPVKKQAPVKEKKGSRQSEKH